MFNVYIYLRCKKDTCDFCVHELTACLNPPPYFKGSFSMALSLDMPKSKKISSELFQFAAKETNVWIWGRKPLHGGVERRGYLKGIPERQVNKIPTKKTMWFEWPSVISNIFVAWSNEIFPTCVMCHEGEIIAFPASSVFPTHEPAGTYGSMLVWSRGWGHLF